MITTGKKRYSCLSDGLCCCIVFCSGGLRPEKKKVPVVCLAKEKRYSRLSVGCAVLTITTGKKKDTVICLAGCAVVLFFVVAGNFDYDQKKKRYSRLSLLANVCIFVQPNTLLLCIFNLFFLGCNSF